MTDRRLTLPARYGSKDWYEPVDVAEAAEYQDALTMPRRHRADVNREITRENVAIGQTERSHLVDRTCVYCPADAELTCGRCDEWVCIDDHVDGTCWDCLGLMHGGRGSA